jgi:hypothetical protein
MKEEVMEILVNFRDSQKDFLKNGRLTPSERSRSLSKINMLEQIMEKINSINSKWISVKDHLPKVHERVILYSEYHGITTGWMYNNNVPPSYGIDREPHERSYMVNAITSELCDSVTHWMPIIKEPIQ